MKVFIGVDVSLASSAICVLNDAGNVISESKIASDPEAFVSYMRDVPHEITGIGMEAGPLSQWLYEGLARAGLKPVLMETRLVKKVLDASPVKTDRRDAQGIARLLQCGWYREVHCKSVTAQETRALLTGRSGLKKAIIGLELSLRGVLRNFGLKMGQISKRDYDARVQELVVGNDMLRDVALPILQARSELRKQLATLERQVRSKAKEDPVCRKLMTMPGIGPVVALTYRAAIDDPTRFRRSKDIGPWVGLTPRLDESGERSVVGNISKYGDVSLRSALYQAANIMLNRGGENWLKTWALQLVQRCGNRRKAKVALARRIGVVLHRMWVDNTDFQYVRSEATTPSLA